MTRTYGALQYCDEVWRIPELEPHVVIRLKQLFPRIAKTAAAPFDLPANDETATDLDWFTSRYPLRISPADEVWLKTRRASYEALQTDMARILAADYQAPAYAGLRVNPATGELFEIRPYQAQAVEVLQRTGGLLLGDEVGLGKTYMTCGALLQPGALPGVVVCHAHLQRQWCEVIEKVTTLKAHAVRGTRPYALPPCDVRVFRYTQLAGWCDLFDVIGCGLAVWDETQELRRGQGNERSPVQKGVASMRLARSALRRLGLTATPIYNYGIEMWNVMSFLRPEVLADYESFSREWCRGGGVADPKALGTYLREQHAFLRRTKADVGQHMPPVNKIVDYVDYDGTELAAVEDLARDLAYRATFGEPKLRGEATRMLDLRLRHATGVSKARAVARMVRILVEGGEPVVLVGWHREVYEIWQAELGHLNPVLYTGSESAAGKNRTKDDFVEGRSDLLIMSLRSGAGLDGLQFRCSTMVFGELDWSPGIHHQCVGRLDREGQARPVTALYLVADDGSDPPMMEVLGLKASQAASIVDPTLGVQKAHTDTGALQTLVKRYLAKKGAPHSAVARAREALGLGPDDDVPGASVHPEPAGADDASVAA